MLLAIDTSGPLCSAALLDGAEVYERSDDIGRGHAEHLMGMLEELLDEAGAPWGAVSRIASSTGPGSFTGLRVGLATARGLALALECPCIGVTVFEAFAEEFGQADALCVAMDARRDQVWMQCFDEAVLPSIEPAAVSSSEAHEQISPGATRFAGSAAAMMAQNVPSGVVVSNAASPSIAALARRAASKPDEETRPKPLYLRAPDAKPQKPLMSGAVIA